MALVLDTSFIFGSLVVVNIVIAQNSFNVLICY